MRKKPILVIKLSSNEDTVTVGAISDGEGQVYDRSKMDRKDRDMMRRIIVEGLFNG